MKEATLQIDESVKIPAAVRAAAARSEELFNAMRDTPVETQEVTSEGNPELDPAALANDNQPQANDNQPAQVAEPAPPAQEPAPKSDEETWEHRYKSEHGRNVRNQQIIREQAETIQNLQGVIATMQATAPVQEVSVPELQAERLITDEEVSDYGEDFLKVVGKKAREEMAPYIRNILAENEAMKKKIEGMSGKVAQDSHAQLLSKLDEKLPNWREMNTNEAFLDWLSLPDPYSGDIRHNMLKAAYSQGDASRVLAFFNGFLAEEAAVAPAKAEPDPTVTTVPKVPLSNLAAPGRAKTAAASNPAPAEKPIFTRAQIASFYADVAAGKYRGRDADKSKAEAEIFAAQREGRIR